MMISPLGVLVKESDHDSMMISPLGVLVKESDHDRAGRCARHGIVLDEARRERMGRSYGRPSIRALERERLDACLQRRLYRDSALGSAMRISSMVSAKVDAAGIVLHHFDPSCSATHFRNTRSRPDWLCRLISQNLSNSSPTS
jgi:hypothetical protein